MKHGLLHFVIAIVGFCFLACPQVYMDIIGLALILNFAIRSVSFHCSEEFSHGIAVGRSAAQDAVREKLEVVFNSLEADPSAARAQLAIYNLINELKNKDPQL